MVHRSTHKNGICTCYIIPEYILEAIAKNGTLAQRDHAQRSLALDVLFRTQRAARLHATPGRGQDIGTPRRSRLIHTADNAWNLPGRLIRREGQGPSGDVAIDEAYDGLGATFDLYYNIYGRNSIDDIGMDLIGSVHAGSQWDNAMWNGTQMVFGDGDGTVFNRFTIAIDIIGHELAHGVTERTAGLEYHDQPGALNESISDVFGSLVKQWSLGQTAVQADWLIGSGIWAAGINGVALRSMKAPGTAYDDPLIGKDPQPDHMSRYNPTPNDHGGVHINSGIPNKAFFSLATALGGNAWDVAGTIWYRTLLDPRLSVTAEFQDFANLSSDIANKLYGASVKAAVVQAWHDVGIEARDIGSNPQSARISINWPPEGQVFHGAGPIEVRGDGNSFTRHSPTRDYEQEIGPIYVELGGSLVEADVTFGDLLSFTWSATINASAGIDQVAKVKTIIILAVSDRRTGEVVTSSTRKVTLTRRISVI